MASKKKELLTMDRNGEFHVWAYGPNHCGRDNNMLIKYHMTCECTVKTDKRGFLFDQVGVDNYFKSISRTKLSCEKLTMACVNNLIEMIHKENPVCQILRIELSLSPAPHVATMKYSWVSPEAEKFEKGIRNLITSVING